MGRTITDKSPYYHSEAVAFLSSIIKPSWTILETGCGSSTLWFSKRAKRVIAFEHSGIWFAKLWELIEGRKIKNVELHLYPNYPKLGIHGFEKDEFDLIAIDGNAISRVKSVETMFPYLKSRGYLLLDDSENEAYKEVIILLDKWERREFGNNKKHSTTIWRKP